MRGIVPFALACAIAGCSSPLSPVAPAVAVGGVQIQSGPPVSTSETYVSDSCGFPVRIDLEGKVKEIPLPGDRLKVLFPGYSAALTNVASGEHIALSTTGSFHLEFLANGHTRITYAGRNTYDDPFEGRLLFLIGNFSEEFDENFNFVQPLDGRGQIHDLCAALAS